MSQVDGLEAGITKLNDVVQAVRLQAKAVSSPKSTRFTALFNP
jgi:hypothetical protein